MNNRKRKVIVIIPSPNAPQVEGYPFDMFSYLENELSNADIMCRIYEIKVEADAVREIAAGKRLPGVYAALPEKSGK